jgi:hypothetical protein
VAHAEERAELVRFFEILFTNTTADIEMILPSTRFTIAPQRARRDGPLEIVFDARFPPDEEGGRCATSW